MTKFSIKPLEDRAIVKPAPEEEKTKGGIIIPDTANKEKPQHGEVIAVGPGKKDDPMDLKPGDKVIYGKYAGSEYKHCDGVTYLIMRKSDIIGIVE